MIKGFIDIGDEIHCVFSKNKNERQQNYWTVFIAVVITIKIFY